MARMGKVDIRGLHKSQREVEKLSKNADDFAQSCAKELAARLLRLVIKRTPVGDYNRYWTDKDGTRLVDVKSGKEIVLKKSAKKGGKLRRGWTTQKNGSGAEGLKTNGASQFMDSINVQHFGDTYVIEIVNPVEYASYVEYGHRKANHKGWVRGRFMMTISEQEIREAAPKILEKKIEKFLRGVSG